MLCGARHYVASDRVHTVIWVGLCSRHTVAVELNVLARPKTYTVQRIAAHAQTAGPYVSAGPLAGQEKQGTLNYKY